MASAIPQIQAAGVFRNHGPDGHVRIINDHPVAQPGEKEVLVKIEYSGICGSDLRALIGQAKPRTVSCHEGVGRVVQLGTNVSSTWLDQRVGIKWLWRACGNCYTCKDGWENYCPFQSNTGPNNIGTLQQYALGHVDYLTRIPEELSSEVAASLLCAGLSAIGAYAMCEEALGENTYLVIAGCGGGIGHLALQLAARDKKRKKLEVISIDTGAAKKRLTLDLGADAFIDFETEDVVKRVMELTGGNGANAAIVVPGEGAAYDQAVQYLRHRGVLVCEGLTSPDYQIPLSPLALVWKGLVIKGAHVGNEKQMTQLLEAAVRKEIVPLVEVHEFSDVTEVFEKLKHVPAMGRHVVRLPH